MSDEIFIVKIFSRNRYRCRKLECKEIIHNDIKLDVDLVWLNFLNDKDPSGELVNKKLTEVCTVIGDYAIEYEEEYNPIVTCYFRDEGIMNTRIVYGFHDKAIGDVSGDYYDYDDIVYDITGHPFLEKLDHEDFNPYRHRYWD